MNERQLIPRKVLRVTMLDLDSSGKLLLGEKKKEFIDGNYSHVKCGWATFEPILRSTYGYVTVELGEEQNLKTFKPTLFKIGYSVLAFAAYCLICILAEYLDNI